MGADVEQVADWCVKGIDSILVDRPKVRAEDYERYCRAHDRRNTDERERLIPNGWGLGIGPGIGPLRL